MAAGKKPKATKKFEQKHLKGVLEHRKSISKIKQRQQARAKKQAKRAKDTDFYGGKRDKNTGHSKEHDFSQSEDEPERDKNGAMITDECFKRAFKILGGQNPKKKAKMAKTLGKRKRGKPGSDKSEDDQASIQSDPSASSDSPSDSESIGGESVEDEDDVQDDKESHGMSKEAMDALAEKDPEFYEFLKRHDPEVLEFDDKDLAALDELSSDDEDDAGKLTKKRKQDKPSSSKPETSESHSKGDLTRAQVAQWKVLMVERHSLAAAKQVVFAFRSAAHLHDDDKPDQKHGYSIASPEVYHDIIMLAIQHFSRVLKYHIPLEKVSSSGKSRAPAASNKKSQITSVLTRIFTASVLHLSRHLPDSLSLGLAIKSLDPLIPYLLPFRKLLKDVIARLGDIWTEFRHEEAQYCAFDVLLELVKQDDKGIREAVLKSVYRALLKSLRPRSFIRRDQIDLMKTQLVMLWAIDSRVGYATAFGLLRQLAMVLRDCIRNNKKDSVKTVYIFSYIHAIDFWSRLLSQQCSQSRAAETGQASELQPLLYPYVQVALGMVGVSASPEYYPYRLDLIEALIRLASSTDTYIPVAPALIEALDSAEMRKPSAKLAKSAKLRPLDLEGPSTAPPKDYKQALIYRDAIAQRTLDLLAEHCVLYSTHISFPELVRPLIFRLKRLASPAVIGQTGKKLAAAYELLIRKFRDNSQFIEDHRSKVSFAPKDRAQIESFLKDYEWEKTPLGAYVVSQRKLRAERQKLQQQAREEDERLRKQDQEETKQKRRWEDEGIDEDNDDDLISDEE